MQWVLLYLSIGHDSVIVNISHSTAKMCRSTIMHVPAAPVPVCVSILSLLGKAR
jgi:hypothetical protein